MFESLVSRLTSPPVVRRRHTAPATREVCSEPEEEAAPAQRRSRAAKHLLDKRRKARLSCADLTAPEPERSSRMDAIMSFLPLRQSKSLGRLDGLKEVSHCIINFQLLLDLSGSRYIFVSRLHIRNNQSSEDSTLVTNKSSN